MNNLEISPNKIALLLRTTDDNPWNYACPVSSIFRHCDKPVKPVKLEFGLTCLTNPWMILQQNGGSCQLVAIWFLPNQIMNQIRFSCGGDFNSESFLAPKYPRLRSASRMTWNILEPSCFVQYRIYFSMVSAPYYALGRCSINCIKCMMKVAKGSESNAETINKPERRGFRECIYRSIRCSFQSV